MLWWGHRLAGLSDIRHTVYSLSKDWSTSLQSVGQFFYMLLLVVVVSVLAYYTTRLVASAKLGRGGQRNLEILESMGVGSQSYIHVIRVGKQYVLIGSTRGQVNILTQLDANQLQLSEAGQRSAFDIIFAKFQRKNNDTHNFYDRFQNEDVKVNPPEDSLNNGSDKNP
ncbi:MAG: flagellar biosynthetic protein FliO [Defluviitaleaceae bacterium]|nr:flagellar biosynthetic protein FliO [Defluviitaleaceae bacterium]